MATDVPNEWCGNCRFWRGDQGGEGEPETGQCRRFPPTTYTPNEEWCGEWQPIKPEPTLPSAPGKRTAPREYQ